MVLCGSNRDYVEDSAVAGVMIASQKIFNAWSLCGHAIFYNSDNKTDSRMLAAYLLILNERGCLYELF